MKIVSLFLLFLLLGCGEQKDSTGEKATITFNLDRAALEKIDLSKVSNPRKVEKEFKKWLAKQDPKDLENNQERIIFGQTAPAPASGFSCYAVVAQYPEEADSSSCRNGDLTKVFGGDEVYGFVGLGGTLSGDVVQGSNRTFYLIGLFASGVGCPSTLNTFPNAVNENYSPPVLLGQTTVNIQSGVNVVNLSANLTATEISGCEGDILGGDTSLDSCKPEINTNANNQTVGVDQFAAGSGTSLDPWIICNAQQLHNFSTTVTGGGASEFFSLGTNIDMSGSGSFIPAGCAAGAAGSCNGGNFFTGKLDGNGFTVANLSFLTRTAQVTGLIGVLKGGTVQNLILKDANLNASANKVGLIAGSAYGPSVADKAIIKSVVAQGLITILGNTRSYIGGVVGNIVNYTSILKAKNSANITGTGSNLTKLGGIVGKAAAGVGAVFLDQVGNTGKIDVQGANNKLVGGIMGSAYPGSSVGKAITISNAYNRGSILARSSAGGILGNKNGGGTILASITKAFNSGKVLTITSGGTGAEVGGIVGRWAPGLALKYLNNVGPIYNSGSATNANAFGGVIAGKYAVGAPTDFANLYVFDNTAGNILSTVNSKCDGDSGGNGVITVGTNVCTNGFVLSDFQGNSTGAMYGAWDFNSIWEVVTGDLPKLRNLPE